MDFLRLGLLLDLVDRRLVLLLLQLSTHDDGGDGARVGLDDICSVSRMWSNFRYAD